MKTYLIVAGDFVTTGGMDRANYALASYLARKGHEVHLVAHRASEDLTVYPNVFFHRVPKPLASYFLGSPLLDRIGRLWARRISARGGRVVVNGGNCPSDDVNWVHYVHAAYTPHTARNPVRRLKALLNHGLAIAAERDSLRRARLLVANSQRTASDLVTNLGIAPERVRVVYYGTDPTSFCPPTPAQRAASRSALGWPSNRLTIAFVGALGDRRKGFDIIFTAWARLCDNPNWDVDLAVIGSGAELPDWRRRATTAGIANRIRFLGFRRDVPMLLAACDAVVAPARYEAFGLGVQEAMCCGLPVLISSNSGVAERIQALHANCSDMLVGKTDSEVTVDELIDSVTKWRAAHRRYASIATAAAFHLRSYTWDHMAEQFLEAIGSSDQSPSAPDEREMPRPGSDNRGRV